MLAVAEADVVDALIRIGRAFVEELEVAVMAVLPGEAAIAELVEVKVCRVFAVNAAVVGARPGCARRRCKCVREEDIPVMGFFRRVYSG
jgi:hypothetical protein